MEFGIKTIGKNKFCANCGRLIVQDKEVTSNYCFVCGAPLKMEAIEAKEKEVIELNNEFVKKLQSAAEELKTDSLQEVLKNI